MLERIFRKKDNARLMIEDLLKRQYKRSLQESDYENLLEQLDEKSCIELLKKLKTKTPGQIHVIFYRIPTSLIENIFRKVEKNSFFVFEEWIFDNEALFKLFNSCSAKYKISVLNSASVKVLSRYIIKLMKEKCYDDNLNTMLYEMNPEIFMNVFKNSEWLCSESFEVLERYLMYRPTEEIHTIFMVNGFIDTIFKFEWTDWHVEKVFEIIMFRKGFYEKDPNLTFFNDDTIMFIYKSADYNRYIRKYLIYNVLATRDSRDYALGNPEQKPTCFERICEWCWRKSDIKFMFKLIFDSKENFQEFKEHIKKYWGIDDIEYPVKSIELLRKQFYDYISKSVNLSFDDKVMLDYAKQNI